jgi:hypothetical protein
MTIESSVEENISRFGVHASREADLGDAARKDDGRVSLVVMMARH